MHAVSARPAREGKIWAFLGMWMKCATLLDLVGRDSQIGVRLANAGIVVQLRLSNPDGIVTLDMRDKPRPDSPERTIFSAAVLQSCGQGKGKESLRLEVRGLRRNDKWG